MNPETKTPDLLRLAQNLENAIGFYSSNLADLEIYVRRINNIPKTVKSEEEKTDAPTSCFVEHLTLMIHKLENENKKLSDVLRVLQDTI